MDDATFHMFANEIEEILSKISVLQRQVKRLSESRTHVRKPKAEDTKPVQARIMAGNEVTLSAALSSNQLNIPSEITLKSPRQQKIITIKSPSEGPLKWDADNKRWVKENFIRNGAL